MDSPPQDSSSEREPHARPLEDRLRESLAEDGPQRNGGGPNGEDTAERDARRPVFEGIAANTIPAIRGANAVAERYNAAVAGYLNASRRSRWWQDLKGSDLSHYVKGLPGDTGAQIFLDRRHLDLAGRFPQGFRDPRTKQYQLATVEFIPDADAIDATGESVRAPFAKPRSREQRRKMQKEEGKPIPYRAILATATLGVVAALVNWTDLKSLTPQIFQRGGPEAVAESHYSPPPATAQASDRLAVDKVEVVQPEYHLSASLREDTYRPAVVTVLDAPSPDRVYQEPALDLAPSLVDVSTPLPHGLRRQTDLRFNENVTAYLSQEGTVSATLDQELVQALGNQFTHPHIIIAYDSNGNGRVNSQDTHVTAPLDVQERDGQITFSVPNLNEYLSNLSDSPHVRLYVSNVTDTHRIDRAVVKNLELRE